MEGKKVKNSDKVKLMGIELPASTNKNSHLSIEYGEHGKEWHVCYKSYYEFSEPETRLNTYDPDLKTALKLMQGKLNLIGLS